MFAGTGLPDGVMVTIYRPHLATSNITVASGDVTYVVYSLTYNRLNNFSLQLKLQNCSGPYSLPNTICGTGNGSSIHFYHAKTENCDDAEYIHDWYVLRINGSTDMDSKTVICEVLDLNNLGDISNCNTLLINIGKEI